MTDQDVLIGTIASELASAAGALLGARGASSPAGDLPRPDWVVRIAATGTWQGAVTVGFAAAEAASLARRAMGFAADPDDSVVGDLLREVCGQAFAALAQKPEAAGAMFTAAAPAPVTSAPVGRSTGYRLDLGEALSMGVLLWDQLLPATATAVHPASAVLPSAAHVTSAARESHPGHAYPNLDVILDIDLPLSVRFGETEMTVDALTRLAPGAVIDLGRSPDDPVDVLVNGRMVARGEVVVVGGSYGVRITEVVSAADRLKTMAA